MSALSDKRPQAKKALMTKVFSSKQQPKSDLISLTDFRIVFDSTPAIKVRLIRKGVRAVEVKDMVRMMDTSQDKIFKFLRLSTATVNRKASRDEELSTEDSERVVGMSNLIGQVQAMVEQSGNPAGFDAAKWVAHWLEEPIPALGGECPASYMDTMEGQKLVSNLLSMMQSGAYA
ncbi:antitoxin Xre/MbcA/ParS toxin-binding domain-containing protein [Glaciimonas soli]|nr:antitoxin Xre/MbcA/ParS toxin-binding domain-containing protein [Glaciimonas soli]